MSGISSAMATWARGLVRGVGHALRSLVYFGSRRVCPVCGRSSRKFAPFGVVSREEALCVHCGALERHRLLWIFLTRVTDLFDGTPKTVLHVAPEACLEPRLRAHLGEGYLTADLHDPDALLKIDITDIDYPDGSFDVILCSHVLEHVPDDRRALRELHRTLQDTGWAILLVPITAARTHEDPTIVEPADRLEAFGQEDHVRRYGPDYVVRLRDAGFHVEVTEIHDLVDDDEANRMGLTPAAGEIYCCTKEP